MELLVLAIAFLVTILGIYCITPLAYKLGLADKPNNRKKHDGIIPLVGGLVIYGTVTITALIVIPITANHIYFLVAAGLIVFAGAIDDRFDINFKYRLIMQIFAALIIIYGAGCKLTSFGDLFALGEIQLGYFSTPITIIAFLTLVNAFNMVDGLDGLAGSLSLIALISIFIATFTLVGDTTHLIIGLFIGSMFAYLFFNLNFFPSRLPKIFLGDAGSNLLGFVICAFLITYTQDSKAIMEPVLALWLVAIPLMDLVTIFYRRLKYGKSPFYPDRTHIHHIFIRAGFTKPASLFGIIIIACIFALIGWSLETMGIPTWISFWLFIGLSIFYLRLIGRAWKLAKWLRKRPGYNRLVKHPSL